MSQLESLRFDFDLDSLLWDPDSDLNEIPRYRRSPFRVIEANLLGIRENEDEYEECIYRVITELSHSDAVALANYLFFLWPDVQIVAQIDEDESKDHTSHNRAIALINEHLAALSCCNRDASIKYEDIEVLNEDAWRKCSN